MLTKHQGKSWIVIMWMSGSQEAGIAWCHFCIIGVRKINCFNMMVILISEGGKLNERGRLQCKNELVF